MSDGYGDGSENAVVRRAIEKLRHHAVKGFTSEEEDALRSVAEFVVGLKALGKVWSFLYIPIRVLGFILFFWWVLKTVGLKEAISDLLKSWG